MFTAANNDNDRSGTHGLSKRRFSTLANGENYALTVRAITAEGKGPPAFLRVLLAKDSVLNYLDIPCNFFPFELQCKS